MPRSTCKYLHADHLMEGGCVATIRVLYMDSNGGDVFFLATSRGPAIMAAIMGLGLGVSGWVLGHAPALAELLISPV